MLELLLTLTRAVVRCCIVVAADLVLVDGQTLQADGTTGVDLVGADADLGSEAVAHTISEAGGGIPVNARGVDCAHELLRLCGIGGQDAVGVARGVVVDVSDCVLKGGDGLDGDVEGEELAGVVFWLGVDGGGREGRREGSFAGCVAVKGDALCGETGGDGREEGLEGGLLDEKCLKSIAGGGVVGL